MRATFDYQAQQPDELSLESGDIIKVYRKMADGTFNIAEHSLVPYPLLGYTARLLAMVMKFRLHVYPMLFSPYCRLV